MGRLGLHAGAGTARLLATMCLVLAATPWVASPGSAAVRADDTGSVTVDFDGYPANVSGTGAAPEVLDHFHAQGLDFARGVTALRFSEKSIPAAPDLPRSGDVVITSCYAQEFCTNLIRMSFPEPLTRISGYVGSSAPLRSSAPVVLTAFDAAGAPVGDARVTLPAGQLVPARNPLAVDDPAGRIRSAQIGWADQRSQLSSLVVDDVSLTPFVRVVELTATPPRLELTLTDEVQEAEITVTNTGNVPFPGLLTAFRPGSADPDPDTDPATVDQFQTGCNLGLAPSQECTISLLVTPLRPGTTSGVVEIGIVQARVKTLSRSVLEIPVTVTVAPPTTSSASPTSTASATPTVTGTVTATPTLTPTDTATPTDTPTPTTTTGSGGSARPPFDVTSLTERMPWLLVPVAIVVLGMLLGPALVRRSHRRTRPSPRTAPVDPPRLRIRPGSRHHEVSGPGGPVLVLVAVCPPAATRVTEDPR